MFFIDENRATGNERDIDAYLFLNKTTWMNAETLCKSKQRHLSQYIYLDVNSFIPVEDTEQLESMNLDVWIGLVASLDLRTVQSKQNIFI